MSETDVVGALPVVFDGSGDTLNVKRLVARAAAADFFDDAVHLAIALLVRNATVGEELLELAGDTVA